MNLSDIAVLSVADYRCIINGFSKNEVINLLKNIDLTEKAEHYKYKKFIFTFENG